MGRKPRINSFIYTYGKFGKGFREILDTENKFLYSHGRYPTKIVAEDLPEDYIKIHSRTLCRYPIQNGEAKPSVQGRLRLYFLQRKTEG